MDDKADFVMTHANSLWDKPPAMRMRWGKVEKPVIVTAITGFRAIRGNYRESFFRQSARPGSMTAIIDSVR
jgi:hypothetical protein